MRKKISIPLSWLVLLAILIIQLVNHKQDKEWQQSWDDRIDVLFDQQYTIDSLYHNHLSTCSFIDRESVKVGRNGNLYSAYHKTDGGVYGR